MNIFDFLVFVDDDYATNYYHEIIIKDADIVKDLKFFQVPREALDFIQQNYENTDSPNPEVIFIDINMPQIDGWKFLSLLGEMKIENFPAIIMLSTSINPRDEERAKNNPHVFDFMNKPLTIEYLEKLKIKLNTPDLV